MKKILFFLFSFFVLSVPFSAFAGNDPFTIEPANPVEKYASALGYEIKPGDDLRDEIIVRNLSSVDHVYKLFPLDYETSGEHPGLKGDENPGDTIAKWLTLGKKEVSVKAKSFEKVGFTLKVSSDVPLGNYRGVIVATATNDSGTANNNDSSKSNASFAVLTRVALGVDVKVTDNPEITNQDTNAESSLSPSWILGLEIFLGLVLLVLLMRLFTRKMKK